MEYPKQFNKPSSMGDYEKEIIEAETNVYAGGVFQNPVLHNGLFNDIIKTIDLIPNDCRIILDIGCNDGSIAKAIEIRKNSFVIGIDICENHVVKTHQRGISALCGNVYDMALPPVDCIFMRHVIEHMIDVPKLLKLMKTKYLVLAIPVCETHEEITDENVKIWHEHDKTHYNIGTMEDWVALIEDNEFEVEDASAEMVYDVNGGGCLTARILARRMVK